jgi:hypothetical protein
MKMIFKRCIRGSDYSSRHSNNGQDRSCRSLIEYIAKYESDYSRCWNLDGRSSDYWSFKNWKCLRR